jgi:predicted TIM-barrel fold metal-dependent hydrolase
MNRRKALQTLLQTIGGLTAGFFTTRHARAASQAVPSNLPRASGGLIDSFSHFSNLPILDFLENNGGPRPHVFRRLFTHTPTLIDAQQRIALMDELGVERSVLVPLPWLETAPAVHADPSLAVQAARRFNDDLAGVVARWPDRFTGVALLPTTNQEIMLAEFERAVQTLHFAGGMFVVGPTVKPPDHPDYWALYARAEALDAALWVHPSRPPIYPDYVGEKMSQFQVWQGLSWLLDSSTAMVRLVFDGLFDKHPDIKIIIHHHGALIPLFAQRMQYGWDFFEQNTGRRQPTQISRPYIDHFKNFYVDTATQGNEPQLLQIAVDFFSSDRMLFGSDCPMDATGGRAFTTDARQSVQGLTLPPQEKEAIFSGNARRILQLT